MTNLERLKKSNQAYKLRLAQKAGFSTVEEYKTFLTTPTITKRKRRITPVVSVKPEKKITIHVVDILDASGSMSGGKFNNSKAGITKGVEDLKTNKDANFTYTLIEFVESNHIITEHLIDTLPNYIRFCSPTGGDTPLYQTVHDSLIKLDHLIKKEDKVLVKVYTDGGNNTAYGYTSMARNIIARLQKENFTITFVATKEDMAKIQSDLSLDKSNTLEVTNDAVGFAKAFDTSLKATRSYASGASAGLDVSSGFYKQKGTL